MDKHIWKIDLALIIVSVLVMMAVVGYGTPLVIGPVDGFEADGSVLFEFEGASVFEIDDNVDFSSSDKYSVREGLILNLEPGVYYWKVKRLGSSEVRSLTIRSRVELEVVETESGFGVRNAGNTRLKVEVYEGEEKLSEKSVGVGGVSVGGDKFVGGLE